MLDGAVVTCVLVFLVCGIWGTVRSAIQYRSVHPYRRYLAVLKRVSK